MVAFCIELELTLDGQWMLNAKINLDKLRLHKFRKFPQSKVISRIFCQKVHRNWKAYSKKGYKMSNPEIEMRGLKKIFEESSVGKMACIEVILISLGYFYIMDIIWRFSLFISEGCPNICRIR